MKNKIAIIIGVALLAVATVQAQTNITIGGVSIPIQKISAQDVQNLDNTIANVEAATNGLSFTNDNWYAGSGYQNADGVGAAQQAYVDFAARLKTIGGGSSQVGLGAGAKVVFDNAGSDIQSAEGRVLLFKDLSNFQLYGGAAFGRNFELPVGFYAGADIGVRYNLSAAIAGSQNPILNLIAGSKSIHTYAQTEFDMDVPFTKPAGSPGIDKLWEFGVGVSF